MEILNGKLPPRSKVICLPLTIFKVLLLYKINCSTFLILLKIQNNMWKCVHTRLRVWRLMYCIPSTCNSVQFQNVHSQQCWESNTWGLVIGTLVTLTRIPMHNIQFQISDYIILLITVCLSQEQKILCSSGDNAWK